MSDLYVLLFEEASSSSLQFIAESYVRQLEIVNAPAYYAPSAHILPVASKYCVMAEPGKLSYNFHSQVIQGTIGMDIPRMEYIADVAWQRISEEPNEMMFFNPSTLLQMEREARVFLDGQRGYSALNAAEIMDFSLQYGRDLTLTP